MLLAELALARIPGLIVTKAPIDLAFDFLVATEQGVCFFVVVKAFSSSRHHLAAWRADEEWKWKLDAETVRHARESRNSFLLFVFDADTDLGRFLRLDTLPEPNPEDSIVRVRLPAENVINKENLEAIIAAI